MASFGAEDADRGAVAEASSITANPLSQSLQRPRKAFAKHTLKPTPAPKAADGEDIPLHKLPLLRVDDVSELRRATRAEADEVLALGKTVSPTGTSTHNLAGVKAMLERRMQRHDETVRTYEQYQRKFYGELEDAVLRTGRELREGLADVDRREEAQFAHVNDPAVAVQHDKHWLNAQYAVLDNLEHERRRRIRTFGAAMDDIEKQRADTLGARLHALTITLIDIGYALEPEIQRLVERYANEVNVVTADNRKSHADVLARLEKAAIASRREMERKWAESEQAWRDVKHADAITRFCTLLNSDRYVNPSDRVAALAAMNAALKSRHEGERLPLIHQLAQLRPPQLTEETVDEIRTKLEGIESEDTADSSSRFQQVKDIQTRVLDSARASVEALRADLHRYEAKIRGGHLVDLSEHLQDVLDDPAHEDFFRKAGGLRVELANVVAAARANDVIYSGPLQALQARLQLLVDAFAVGPALADAGKGAERTALLTTLDNMRTAKRTDMPAAVVKLHRLLSSISRVPGLPETVTVELETILESLGDTIEEINEALVSAGVEVPPAVVKFLSPDGGAGGSALDDVASLIGRSMTGSGVGTTRTGRSSAKGARSGRSSSAGKRSSSRGSQGRGSSAGRKSTASRSKSSHRTRKTAGIKSEHKSILTEMTDAVSSVMGQVLPMPAIRALQKRCAVLVASSDLSESGKELLSSMLEACEQQSKANQVVDAIIDAQAAPLVAAREAEANGLLSRVGQALDAQASRLNDAGQMLCAYYEEVAKMLHRHAKAEHTADEVVADALGGALDNYEDEDAALEAAFTAAMKAVREAPELKSLDERCKKAIGVLDSIEQHYRQYADTVLRWSKQHPNVTASALRVYRKALCNVFGLQFPAAATVDGESIPNEERRRAVKWTPDGPVQRAVDAGGQQSTSSDALSATATAADTLPAAPVEISVVVSLQTLVSESPALLHAEPQTVSIGAATSVPITFSALDLTAMNLGSTVQQPPPAPAAAEYKERIPADFIARFLVDGAALKEEAAIAKQAAASASESSPAVAATDAAKAEDAAKAKGGKAPAKDDKKKSKAELEAEAKAAEAAAAAAAAAAAEAAAEEARRQREAELAAAAEKAATATFKFGYFNSEGSPVDPDGTVAVVRLVVAVSDVSSMLQQLREYLLSSFEQYAAERKAIVVELTTSRCAAFTAELEERLRRHWPRKGMLEVSVRAPREAELIEHKQRVDRHIRRTEEKHLASGSAFDDALAQAYADIELGKQKVAALQDSLPAQNNLATLQGVVQRCRQLKSVYTQACADAATQLRKRSSDDAAKLVGDGDAFIASCTLFSDGGAYDGAEVELYRTDVEELHSRVKAAATTHDTLVIQLEAAQSASQSVFESFFVAYEKALKDLSMREGLGPKYGAPRRTATEAIRTTIQRSESTAELIDGRLDELIALLSSAPGEVVQVPPPPTVDPNKEATEILRASRGWHEDVPTGSAPAPDASKGAKPAAPAAAAKPATPAPGAKGAAAPAANADAQTSLQASAAAEQLKTNREAELKAKEESEIAAGGAAPLSVRIRRVVMELRDLLYTRALFLQALKTVPDLYGPLRTFNLPFLSLTDVPTGCVMADIGTGVVSGSMPDLQVPPAYGTSGDKASIILPLGTVYKPSPTGDASAEHAAAVAQLTTSHPHTAKGPSPGPAAVAAQSARAFMQTVSDALEACKESTRVLYAEEGIKIEKDEQLPESLRKWIDGQLKKCADLREFSARRFRDQVDKLAAILPEAPALLVEDIFARSLAEAGADANKRLKVYRAQAHALEDVRAAHVDALRLSLGDPNAVAALQSLVDRERQRTKELRDVISTARGNLVHNRIRHGHFFTARLLHGLALFMLSAEECVVREDLAPLPGDELVVPKKLSFKRLHKTLRKSGAAPSAVAAVALGDVDVNPQDEDDGAPAAAAAAAAPAAKGGAGGKGAAAAAPTPADGDVLTGTKAVRDVFARRTWAGLAHPSTLFTLSDSPATAAAAAALGSVTCVYSSWSRHVVAERDRVVEAYLQAFQDSVSSTNDRFAAAGSEVDAWEAAWLSKVSALRNNLGAPLRLAPVEPPAAAVAPLAEAETGKPGTAGGSRAASRK